MNIKKLIKIVSLLFLSTLSIHQVSAEPPPIRQSIIGLYTAYYNRAPDQNGFNFWNNQATANNTALLSLSKGFMSNPQFLVDYPNNISTKEFITKIYNNILSRAPDTDGLNYWTSILDNGLEKPEFILTFVNTVLGYTGTVPEGLISQRMFSNKTDVGQYYMDKLGSASNGDPGSLAYTRAIDVLHCVTEDLLTVDAAKALTRQYLTTDEPIENNCATNDISTITGVVKESVSNNALSGVQVRLYNNSQFLKEVITDSTGSYRFNNLPVKSGYSILLIKDNYLTEDYNSIETQANKIKYLETILQINNQYAGIGNVTGNIRNALDGNGVAGLRIDIRKGINTQTGNIIQTTTTDSTGSYTASTLEAGNYTGEISGPGYQTNHFTILVLGGITNEGQNGVINPLLAGGEMRIVLSWGANPSDLDSHLTGPTSTNSSDRFHVYFSDPTSTNVNLDRDDTSSYGPETTTIQQQFEGLYRYSIHDYSNKDSSSSNALANSGAQVKVYNNNGLIAEFNVPNQDGTLWTVFEMRGNQITPVNQVGYLSNEVQFRSNRRNKTDALLLMDLPEKN